MQHKYICFKRFHQNGIEGYFNIRYNTELLSDDKFIYFDGDCNNGRTICAIRSYDAFNHFALNDDGSGLERGNITNSITSITENKKDPKYQLRWNKIWKDDLCNTLRRKDYTDKWLWDVPFYQADIKDLNYILNLIKEV